MNEEEIMENYAVDVSSCNNDDTQFLITLAPLVTAPPSSNILV